MPVRRIDTWRPRPRRHHGPVPIDWWSPPPPPDEETQLAAIAAELARPSI